jgi:Fic family protein
MKKGQSPGRKSRRAVAEERSRILALLTDENRPMARQDVRDAYRRRVGTPIAYNTAKARLEELQAGGLVQRSPKGQRPVTYRAVSIRAGRVAEQGASENGKPGENGGRAGIPSVQIPLSAEAKRLRARLERSRGERTPVGYDVDFLEAYVPGTTWYLGQAERERLHELGRTTYMGQPAGTYARDIMQRLVIDLSWGSSRLEGLRYTRIDTAELLDAGRSPAGASDHDRQLILNHKAAIEFLVDEAESISFSRYTILNLHALLAENLLERREQEGALRTRPVTIGNSVYTPTAIPQLIEERFDTILVKAEAISDPIEQSFFVMVHLPYLQPFIDANKRTSRLAANIPLIRENLCPLSFVDVPEATYTEALLGVYEQKDVSLLRDVYAWAYERSCAQFKVLRDAMGEPDPIRLNYRTELRMVVADVVRGMEWPSLEDLTRYAEQLRVPEPDRMAVANEALKDLRALRPEFLARYALRRREYAAWAQSVAMAREG